MLKQFIQFLFVVDAGDRAILKDEMRKINLRNVFISAIIALPVTIYHIVLFSFTNVPQNERISSWHHGVILSHTILMSIAIGLIIYIGFIRVRKLYHSITIPVMFMLFYLGILFIGTLISTYDQLVTTAITPFFIITTFLSVIMIMSPASAMINLGITYIIFYYSIATFQHDPNVLLSNRVNGLTSVMIAFIMSIVFYRANLIRFRQARQIMRQNQDLADNNRSLEMNSNALTVANQTKDRFLHIISHDLRGPMNLMVALSDQLKDSIRSNSEDRLYESDQLYKTARNTQILLDDLLEWSLTQSDHMQIQIQPLYLKSVIHEIQERIQAKLSEKHIQLHSEFPDTTVVAADERMLQTILRNLIGNSIKYTANEGEITIRYRQSNRGHEIEVADTGIGIRPDIIPRLFNITKRISTKGLNDEKGSGLGLILCHEMTLKMGGTIEVESEVGKGSVFRVILPLK